MHVHLIRQILWIYKMDIFLSLILKNLMKLLWLRNWLLEFKLKLHVIFIIHVREIHL